MDYPFAKFGDFNFSRFGFIVRTDRITETDDRYIHATTVGVSNKMSSANNLKHGMHVLVCLY